jgi:DNA-binding transcriptional MerR regulator
MTHPVGQVARLAHVSVRTLHHYDEIGLLVPSGRSEAGYRLYTADDREALIAQRDLLAKRTHRLLAMIDLIDKTLAAQDEGIPMGREEMFEVFGDFDPSEHEDEVKERWGETDACEESARRTRRYTKGDWARFKAESDAVNADIAALLDEGVATGDARAMDAAERHRLLIEAWFYPCPQELHARLGQMYVADPRFAANYERIRPGMAQYVCDAIAANAARATGTPR